MNMIKLLFSRVVLNAENVRIYHTLLNFGKRAKSGLSV